MIFLFTSKNITIKAYKIKNTIYLFLLQTNYKKSNFKYLFFLTVYRENSNVLIWVENVFKK